MGVLHISLELDTDLVKKTFGDIVNASLPRGISLAKLSRAADVDYAYLHGLVKGSRGDKPLSPSLEMVQKIREALINLGAYLSQEDEIDLIETAVDLPDGFEIVKTEDRSVKTADRVRESEAMRYLRGLPPDQHPKARKLLEAAFDEDDDKDAEGTIGRRVSDDAD